MNKIVAALIIFAIGTVSAIKPHIFDKDFLDGKNPLIPIVTTGSFASGPIGGQKLRFIHFIPKIGADFSGGFEPCRSIRGHFTDLLKVDSGDIIGSFTGISNCLSFFGIHVSIFSPDLAIPIHRLFGFLRDPSTGDFNREIFSGLEHLADFLYTRIDKDLFSGILTKKIPTLPLTILIAKKFRLSIF